MQKQNIAHSVFFQFWGKGVGSPEGGKFARKRGKRGNFNAFQVTVQNQVLTLYFTIHREKNIIPTLLHQHVMFMFKVHILC